LTTKHFARRGLLLFAVALAVRLGHVWQIRRAPFFTVLLGDSRAYDEWAQRIAAGDWMGGEVFYQAPLYPYLLGTIYSLAGRNLLLVRSVQAVIGSVSCLVLAAAARRWFSERVGVVAGFMLALYAPAIFFDGLVQKSVLDVFFVSLLLYLTAVLAQANPAIGSGETAERERADGAKARRPSRAARDPGAAREATALAWPALGVTLGALALTRENALVFVVVVLAWALRGPRPRGPRDGRGAAGADARRGIRHALLAAAGASAVLLPVAARNFAVGGGFYLTTSQFGPNFYIGNNARADGTYAPLRYGRGAPEYERADATEIAERAAGRSLTPDQVSRFWTDRALAFIGSHPGAWLRLMARKMALLVNAREMLDTESLETHAEWSWPLRIGAVVGHFGVLVPLAALGMFVSWRDRRRLAIVHALLWSYAASVIVFYVFARYRYALVPFLMLFAAAGVSWLIQVVRDRRLAELARQPATAACVLLVAVAANWPMLSPRLMRTITEHNLGAALQGDQRLDEAIAHYQRAIALSPDYAPAYNNLGTAYRAQGRLPEAIQSYERALAVNPEYREVHYNLANALLESGKIDEAISEFGRAEDSTAGAADVHNNLGIALAAKGQLDSAIAQFREAARVEPGSVKARRNLGDALVSRGRIDEGIDQFRVAARLAPRDGALRHDLGSVLLQAGRLDEAVQELREAVRLQPESAAARNNLGIALGSQGNIEEAIGQFQEALRLQPSFAEAKKNLEMARAARQKGEGFRLR
jgi:tetratricopeptide (TPR) repeat protein